MAGYIGTTPVPQATQHRESFTATGGQTSFATVGYTPQFIDVYLNGVKLAPADFTATNGSDVVLASGATASDILEIVAYTPFEVADQTFTGTTTAANLTVTGAFTSQGIDDNADAVAITIDSSENVGIGTSSPVFSSGYGGLHVHSTYPEVHLTGLNSGSNATDGFKIQKNSANDVYLWNYENAFMVFGTNNAEAMRIDSSRNLLVGKTSDNQALAGVKLGTGGSNMSRNNEVLVLNRLSTDGTILNLKKDGATVGSIGVNSGTRIYIGSGDANLTFNPVGNYVFPSTSTGGARDAQLDLGLSAARFKDLYLSGGVYLGGTGSANKISDYETGTWTPVYLGLTSNPTCTYDIQEGHYTKVGNLVTCTARIRTDAVSGGSGVLALGGLPFNSKDVTANGTSGTLQVGKYLAFKPGEFAPKMGFVQDSNNYCTLLYEGNDNSAGNCNVTALNNSSNDNDMHFSITYLSA